MTEAHTLSPAAIIKPILHSAAHPSSTIIGAFIGKDETALNRIQVVDAVPLLHHWVDLSMAVEMALQLTELYAKERGLEIVGIYTANSRLADTAPSQAVLTIAETLRKHIKQAFILVLDNEKLGNPSEPPFIPYLPVSSSFSAAYFTTSFTILDPSSPLHALEAIQGGKHRLIRDFDDHLEDVTADWLSNKSLGL